jgi:hypothetical protein
VHGVDFFADYLAATRALHRKPMVLTTHGGFFHTSFARSLKQIYLKTVTRASLSQYGAVIACSAEDQRLFAEVAGERLVLISNPVDIDKFAGLADPSSDTIIYFGRLAPNKEVARLIDWFAEFARADPKVRLIVAGKPMGVDPAELEQRAAEHKLQDHFELHVSPSDDELRKLISRSGSYVCASSYEGFGLAAVEAASAGLFPILSDIPPFADTLGRLGYGFTVDFANPSSWARSNAMMKEARASFRTSFDRARVRDAVAPFDWDSAVPRFDEVYRKVLGRETRRIGPVEVDVFDRDAAVNAILHSVEQREPALVTFCNAHTVNLARRDSAFRDILSRFLVLNDGVGVDLASRSLFGQAFPDNLNGTDFTPHLLGASPRPLSVFSSGASRGLQRPPDAISKAAMLTSRLQGAAMASSHRRRKPASSRPSRTRAPTSFFRRWASRGRSSGPRARRPDRSPDHLRRRSSRLSCQAGAKGSFGRAPDAARVGLPAGAGAAKARRSVHHRQCHLSGGYGPPKTDRYAHLSGAVLLALSQDRPISSRSRYDREHARLHRICQQQSIRRALELGRTKRGTLPRVRHIARPSRRSCSCCAPSGERTFGPRFRRDAVAAQLDGNVPRQRSATVPGSDRPSAARHHQTVAPVW